MESIWVDSMVTEEIVSEICKVQSLKELRITHCNFATGEFIKDLKSSALERIDFEGSP
jgi:hypothetical protein